MVQKMSTLKAHIILSECSDSFFFIAGYFLVAAFSCHFIPICQYQLLSLFQLHVDVVLQNCAEVWHQSFALSADSVNDQSIKTETTAGLESDKDISGLLA